MTLERKRGGGRQGEGKSVHVVTTREIETKGTPGKRSTDGPPKTFLTRPLKFGSRGKK